MDFQCRNRRLVDKRKRRGFAFSEERFFVWWFLICTNSKSFFAEWLLLADHPFWFIVLYKCLFFSISICTPNYTLHTLSLCVTQAVSKRNLANELARFHYFQYFGCFRVVGIGSGRHFRLPLLSFHVTALLNSHSRFLFCFLFETRCVFPVRVLCC